MILSTGWGAHVMRRLGNHDQDVRTLGERLVEVEKLRAKTELETATVLARLEEKVELLIELSRTKPTPNP